MLMDAAWCRFWSLSSAYGPCSFGVAGRVYSTCRPASEPLAEAPGPAASRPRGDLRRGRSRGRTCRPCRGQQRTGRRRRPRPLGAALQPLARWLRR